MFLVATFVFLVNLGEILKIKIVQFYVFFFCYCSNLYFVSHDFFFFTDANIAWFFIQFVSRCCFLRIIF